jgi:two-component system invasion response regulator UvrY
MNDIKKIIVADDHDIVRYGVRMIIEQTDYMQLVAETGDGANVLKLCREHSPHLLLLDITLPNRDGMSILKQAKKEFRELKVLIFSSYDESKYAIRALKAGASGYLNKQNAINNLLPALECVLAGNKYISPVLAQELANWVQADYDRVAHEKLSDRELQTLQLIASGLSVGDIAVKLNLSVKTISMYRARTLEKLALRHNAELMHYAIEHQLI